ncbi:hypothetical protein SELMODRAFT_442380 [Selaginella moellendorffii]|uniref:Rho-GAP domain-containing protein n=1 Tax=Selaginella moellendorffii TaxID=88036 RepID=D8RSZ1_SELML|nr:rho GTPase-activating protein 7 [Selaginella moellendorffii]EFJ24423.1 hypothetical protein SELMODRAFT_442380 [Selaginella moellendorffii]|eukprot:XP_002974201.1 rho GTPase-activating protein 7 [Selaginella moellendorffii]
MVTPFERPRTRSNAVFKSGPLLISSKGLGWKSWKRRWFILTRTSLVFFKDDPNVLPLRGSEASMTLGGIDLNNSGSVLVRADKKLLTVMFPDGRTVTLKAETSEDVEEWKVALERALAAAPNAALVVGHDGIFRNDSIDVIETSTELGKDRRSVKSMVVGRPILLALEDIDGSPSFLEKALCFIERYGVKAEGILRQCADVEEVEHRIRDYEQGKTSFSPDEDAHVVSDCIKLVLRELPSSPVPTPCCTALLEAYRLESKEARITSMRLAVADTFPEPNRRLLQRVLRMGRAIAAHTSDNLMTASAVATCMAPLLLRPLIAGECGLEDDSDISGDHAAQVHAAAVAANNAQAIVTTLLEEYDNIFEDNDQQGPPSPEMYPNLEGSESGESSEEEVLQMHETDGYHDAENDLDAQPDEDPERVHSGALSETSSNAGSDTFDYKAYDGKEMEKDAFGGKPLKGWSKPIHLRNENRNEVLWEDSGRPATTPKLDLLSARKPSSKLHASTSGSQASSRNEPVDGSADEEAAIQRLELTRSELRAKIAKEAKGNAILQASLERRKQALHDRRLALEQDVAKLQEQLRVERELRTALESGFSLSTGGSMDSQTRAELEEIAVVEADVAELKKKVAELHIQLNQQRQQQVSLMPDTSERQQRYKSLQSQQKILQQELDVTLALCHHERQRNDELESQTDQDASSLEHVLTQQRNALLEAKEALKAERVRGHDLRRRTIQQENWQALQPPSGPSARQFAWKNQNEMAAAAAAAAVAAQRHAPSPLAELTTRLDYFKERRSHLLEELHSLDPSLAVPLRPSDSAALPPAAPVLSP